MPVRRNDRMLDHVAHDFAARQLGGIDALPVRQQRARERLIALVERVADVGEMVAELAKAERHVEHRNAPQHGKRQAQREHQQPVHAQRQQRGHEHREPPGNPSVVRLARIEVAAGPARPRQNAAVHGVVRAQRPHLLDQQRAQDGKEAHPSMIARAPEGFCPRLRPIRFRRRGSGRGCATCPPWRPRRSARGGHRRTASSTTRAGRHRWR